jgi:hypothetical protein
MDYEVDAIGRICPVASDSFGFERKLVRWRRIGMWDFPWDFLDGESEDQETKHRYI